MIEWFDAMFPNAEIMWGFFTKIYYIFGFEVPYLSYNDSIKGYIFFWLQGTRP